MEVTSCERCPMPALGPDGYPTTRPLENARCVSCQPLRPEDRARAMRAMDRRIASAASYLLRLERQGSYPADVPGGDLLR